MKELRYITLAQIIGCFLVIWGHSYPFVTPIPETISNSRGFIYLFHMPLFVFCSGFLFAYTRQTERKSLRLYVTQRVKKLLLPYLVFSLIGLFPKYFTQSVLNDTLTLDFVSLVRVFLVPRENIWGHFWFLPMIYILGVLSFIFDKFFFSDADKKWKWTIICICLIIIKLIYNPIASMQWLGINDVIQFAYCYALGVDVFYMLGDLKDRIHLKRPALLTICIMGGGISLITRFFYPNNSIANLTVALLMIATILLLCLDLEKYTKVNKRSLVAQTYQIFILSWPCQLLMEILLERVLHTPWWIIMPVVFVSGVLGAVMIIYCIDEIEKKTKTRFLSLIIGK